MGKNNKIKVEDIEIGVITGSEDDYICITDMAKSKDSDGRAADVIKNWIRTRSTIEFLGAWEQMHNPDFKVVEFDHFRKQAGLPTFVLSPKNWIEKTNAIGIISKSGRYGGTYAHKDIAFEFGTAISPMFKLLLIKEFQRLKEVESNQYNIEWNVKRILSKVNYRIHTDAVQDFIIPKSTLPEDKKGIEYAKEADLLNLSLFGCTAKEWKEANPKHALSGSNIRDIASINELAVLANMESLNAIMIEEGADKKMRFNKLQHYAKKQLDALNDENFIKSLRKEDESTYVDAPKKPLSDFDKKLNKALKFNPKK